MTYAATILVPVAHQDDRWLRQCLTSAATQSVPCAVIVIPATDTPDSNHRIIDEICRRYANVAVTPQPADRFAKALNRGIAAAATDRVGFLLSDDWLMPTAVAACLENDADIVCTDVLLVNAAGETMREQLPAVTRAEYDRRPTLADKAAFLEHFFLFKRQALCAVGGVDEMVGDVGPDDFDLIWTLLERGADVALVPEPLYVYRDHDGIRLSTRPVRDQLTDLAKVLDKHNVGGWRRLKIITAQASWFGRRVTRVHAEFSQGTLPTRLFFLFFRRIQTLWYCFTHPERPWRQRPYKPEPEARDRGPGHENLGG
jgi:hypothetical protein